MVMVRHKALPTRRAGSTVASMAHPATTVGPDPLRITAERYLRFVDEGVLKPNDRVELLEGVIVTMSPHDPPHAAGVRRVECALHDAVGRRAVVQVQLSLVAGCYSVPEPDVAVVPGALADHDDRHPDTALLVVEVADFSLAQDRITKAALYAAAGFPEYWIVNVRDGRVEVYRDPLRGENRYGSLAIAGRGERIALAALAGVTVAVDDLLPARGG